MIIETNGAKRQRTTTLKIPRRSEGEEPAGLTHGTLLEREQQRANQWEKNAASWKEQCDAKDKLITERSGRIRELEIEVTRLTEENNVRINRAVTREARIKASDPHKEVAKHLLKALGELIG